jgi:hypothetical protein
MSPDVASERNLIAIEPNGTRIPNPCDGCGRPSCYGVGKRWYCTTCNLRAWKERHGS